MQIELGDGQHAYVDDEHFNHVKSVCESWYVDDEGYVRGNTRLRGKRTNIKLHRIIGERIGMNMTKGISFKDGNKLNCRSSNLKPFASKGVESKNPVMQGIYKHYYRGQERWQVVLTPPDGGKKKHYGLFKDLNDAKRKRNNIMKLDPEYGL